MVGVAVVTTSVVISSGKESVVVSTGGSGDGPGAVLLPNCKTNKTKSSLMMSNFNALNVFLLFSAETYHKDIECPQRRLDVEKSSQHSCTWGT